MQIHPIESEYHLWSSPDYNERDGVSNHQPHDYLLNLLFRCRLKKTSKLSFTGLCAGNSPLTNEFPAQMASNAENVSIWWRNHVSSIKTFTKEGSDTLSSMKLQQQAIGWLAEWKN